MIVNPTAKLNKKMQYSTIDNKKNHHIPYWKPQMANPLYGIQRFVWMLRATLTFALAYERQDTHGATLLAAFTGLKPDRDVVHTGLVADEIERLAV